MHSIKTKDDPLALYLSGGAGVGKSTVTNALYETLTRYLNSVPGENPDEIKVLKVEPTGKAAFNIKQTHFIQLLKYLQIGDYNIALLMPTALILLEHS